MRKLLLAAGVLVALAGCSAADMEAFKNNEWPSEFKARLQIAPS